MKTAIWFRSDLRIHDHCALNHAIHRGQQGIRALFVATPKQWKIHDWSPAKVTYVLRSVQALSLKLAALGIVLDFMDWGSFEEIPQHLVSWAAHHDIDEIHASEELEVNEKKRDHLVRQALGTSGKVLHTWSDTTIVDPDLVRTQKGGFFTVFSPYKKTWLKELAKHPLRLLEDPPCVHDPVAPTNVPHAFPEFHRFDTDFPAGEDAALAHFQNFLSQASLYKEQRDYPALDGTSGLSAALAVGSVSPRVLFNEALLCNQGRLDSGDAGLLCWMSELIWREFYRHVLVGFPRVCRDQPFLLAARNIPWRDDKDQFHAWCAGLTGYPLVDAGMRQLKATGWMHNRVRMVVAMFLTKHLLLSWQWGEKFFMQNLVDGDFASNNGGWQWSASTGTDAAPYFRIFNPYLQSKRFDPEGKYIKKWVPELSTLDAVSVHEPTPLECAQTGYPVPLVGHVEARDRALQAYKPVFTAKRAK